MALRTAAGRVDADMIGFMQANAVGKVWPAQERILVCINEAPGAKMLVRAGKRMAERAKLPWIVATVLTPKHESMDAAARLGTQDALRLAETLGAETATLRVASDVAGEILRYRPAAQCHQADRRRPRWQGALTQRLMALIREPVSEKLLDGATDFEVTVVTPHARAERRKLERKRPSLTGMAKAAAAALAAVALATLLAWPIAAFDAVPTGAITVIYLLAVLLTAARFGLAASLAASGLAFLAYNFLYTEPYFTLAVAKASDLVSLGVFLLGALFTGTLASRLSEQVEAMRASQARTETLYEFARKIAAATKSDDVLWAAAAHTAKTLDAHVLILTPDASGNLEQVQGWPSIEDGLDPGAQGAARWAFDKAEPAGLGTGTLPNSAWLFVPLATAGKPFGVIGVKFRDPARAGDPDHDTRRLLLAVEDQVAVAIERNRLSDELAGAARGRRERQAPGRPAQFRQPRTSHAAGHRDRSGFRPGRERRGARSRAASGIGERGAG